MFSDVLISQEIYRSIKRFALFTLISLEKYESDEAINMAMNKHRDEISSRLTQYAILNKYSFEYLEDVKNDRIHIPVLSYYRNTPYNSLLDRKHSTINIDFTNIIFFNDKHMYDTINEAMVRDIHTL